MKTNQVNQIALKGVTIDRQDSSESIYVYAKYIWNGEHKTDHGRLFISSNAYCPELDMDGNEEEYDALQTAVESR